MSTREYQSAFLQLIVCFLLILLSSTAPAATATSTIVLGNDRRTNALNLLVLLLDFFSICLWVRIQPRLPIFERVENLLLFVGVHLLTKSLVVTRAFSCRTHRMNVPIERILCIHALLHFLVLVCELLRLLDHLLDLLLRQAALVVCDRDLLALASALVLRSDVEDAVRIDFKGDLNLRLATGRWRNSTKLE